MLANAAAVELDGYVIDVLMRDLVRHDKMPSAFIVYVYLAVRAEREMKRGIAASYSTIAAATGLSKTAVQKARAPAAEEADQRREGFRDRDTRLPAEPPLAPAPAERLAFSFAP
jgi:hypothetical protein